jgi:hypothetical protein
MGDSSLDSRFFPMSALGPDCVKTFFRPKHCTQPGTIRVDTRV